MPKFCATSMAASLLLLGLARPGSAFFATPGAPLGLDRSTGRSAVQALSCKRKIPWLEGARRAGAVRAAGDGGDGEAPSNVKVPVAVVKDDVASAANPMKTMAGQADTLQKFMGKLEEYKACKDKDQKTALQNEIIEMYVDFAVPAVSLALGTLLSFPGAFAFFFLFLSVTGRGISDVEAMFAALPDFIADPAVDFLGNVDPNLGTAAVAAILVELVSPLLLIVSATLKGRIEVWLNGKLQEWGLDAKGLLARLQRIAGEGEDLF